MQEHNNAMLYEQFKDRIETTLEKFYHIRHKHVILLDDEGNEYFYQKKTKFPSDFSEKR